MFRGSAPHRHLCDLSAKAQRDAPSSHSLDTQPSRAAPWANSHTCSRAQPGHSDSNLERGFIRVGVAHCGKADGWVVEVVLKHELSEHHLVHCQRGQEEQQHRQLVVDDFTPVSHGPSYIKRDNDRRLE